MEGMPMGVRSWLLCREVLVPGMLRTLLVAVSGDVVDFGFEGVTGVVGALRMK